MTITLKVPAIAVPRPRPTWTRIRVLGEGTEGVVYLGMYQTPNGDMPQPVAIKTSRLGMSWSTLAKEFRLLRSFRHCPEIIRCFAGEESLDQDEEVYDLVLEYCPFGTLHGLIERNGSQGLHEKDVRRYTRMILSGLRFIHQRGYVHCDLKPENILICPSQEPGEFDVKLADFGTAYEPEEDLQPADSWKGTFRGTPMFMSPESVTLGEIGPELDIWSLGCVVLEMLTGRGAWSELDKLSEDEFISRLSTMSPEIPEDISEVGKDFLRKCLERNPKKRLPANMLLKHPFVTPSCIRLFGLEIISF